MSTSVFQGLQFCLEPGLVEPRVLSLILAPPKSDLTRSSAQSKEISQQNEVESTTNTNGWSCLQALAKTNVVEGEKIYVHPLVKRASSMLSPKSLEMCTESLGSETGNDVIQGGEEDMVSSLVSEDSGKFPIRESSKDRKNRKELKNLNRSSTFPPPLTSVSGSGGLQVRPHREDGRLVLKAVVVPSCNTYFHAERSDGRLTLRLMRDVPPNSYINNEEEEVEEELVEEDDMCLEAEKEEEGVEEDDMCLEAVKEEEVEGDEAGIEEEEEGEEETEEVSFRRPSRCKDDRESRVIKWEPCWVAT